MRTSSSYIRVLLFAILSMILLAYLYEGDTFDAALKQPLWWLLIGVLMLFAIAFEVAVAALQATLFKTLSPEAKERYLSQEALEEEQRFRWVKDTYKKLLGSKPITEEHEIILDHNYDGIKELDNNLPPWWVYGFYATILFAAIYLIRYHILGAVNQATEYEIEVAEAKIAIEAYKKTAKNLVDVNTVTLLTEASDLSAGKGVFNAKCVACHKADGGGGIGPNLTDSYWILGGGIKNVFNTISEGGRSGKGMVPWKTELKPVEMAQVASYVLSLQGTSPAEPKEPQGEIWIDPDAPVKKEMETKPEQEETAKDTIGIQLTMK